MSHKLASFWALAIFTLIAPFAMAQNLEVTGLVGGQVNGGLDLNTTLFQRIEVGNGVNYGVIGGILLGEHYGAEFQWNHNSADTVAEPRSGAPNSRVFSLTSNQYMGNFLVHFRDKEHHARPFIFFGLGANHLSVDRANVDATTKFAWSIGGGEKLNLSKHIGLRGQIKWTPTYITTTNGGVWCDPFWGGCWNVGNDHYLHEVDFSGGITFRF